MTARQEGLVLIAVLVCFSFVFQVQLKLLAVEIGPILADSARSLADRAKALAMVALGWRALLIVLLAALLFVIWLLALTRLDLSLALPLASLALVINAVGGAIVLGEPLTMLRIGGVLLVAAGLAVLLQS